jgi:hypothetical protein
MSLCVLWADRMRPYVLANRGAKPPNPTIPPMEGGGAFYYTTLFTLYKSPEKKWHRSVKMDKNINVHFSKVPGKCCKMPL